MVELKKEAEHPQMQLIPGGATDSKLHDKIKERQSKILVIAFCGPVGSGISNVVDEFSVALRTFRYDSEKIKLSEFIKKYIQKIDGSHNEEDVKTETAKRIMILQDAGNALRSKYSSDLLSQLAITEIGARRQKRIEEAFPDAKKELLSVLWEYFLPFRAKREEMAKHLDFVDEIRKKGADKARTAGMPTLEKVRKLVGVRR